MLNDALTYHDFSHLVALTPYGMVGINPLSGMAELSGIVPVDVLVHNTEDYPTGIYQPDGGKPVIILNDWQTPLDYDLISQLHPMHDWEVYLWMDVPYADTHKDIGLYGEWYRSVYYPDGMQPFDGVPLGWEDSVNIEQD